MNICSELKIYVSVLKIPDFLIFSLDTADRNNGVWVYFSTSSMGRVCVCGAGGAPTPGGGGG